MHKFTILGTTAVLFLGLACTHGPTDESLSNEIKAKLYSDAVTRAANINVDVKSGVVTLTGDVPGSEVESQAMRLVNGTAGIKSVTDQLKVTTAANAMPDAGAANLTPPPPPPATQRSTANTAATPSPAPVTPATSSPNEPPAPVAVPEARKRDVPATVTIPAGTYVNVRMVDAVDSKQSEVGQVFRASLDSPIVHGNRVLAQAGSEASVVLTDVSQAGRIKGRSGLAVRLSRVNIGGQSYEVNSSVVDQQGGSRGKQTAIRTGIGAAAGALIGGLAGGGKGAAIGSAAGGGAGFGYNVFTHGAQVKIPSETVLKFRLEAPVSVQR